ncbi:MAG: Gfo/Idh/MocA family protein [Lactovum sp.]
MINVGIVGFGFMGQIHAKHIMQLEGYKLVGVCDIDEEKLKETPASVKSYLTMDELFSDSEVDTVILSLTNHVHLEAVEKAAKAKLNIICEKPAALSVEEYDKMLEAVKANDVVFTIHQQRRYDIDFNVAKSVYESQELGDVYTIQSKLYGINGNMHDWHVYPEYGGGMLYDWGVHLIDQMLYMVKSKISSIYADVRNVINKDVDDYFKILIRFENGQVGEIELGTYFLADKEDWFERHWFIGGNKGTMYSDGFHPKGKICKTSTLLENVPGKATMTAAGPTRSFGPPQDGVLLTSDLPEVDVNHLMYFENFKNTLESKEEFIIKPEEVRRVLVVMNAARESSKTGNSISFPEGL